MMREANAGFTLMEVLVGMVVVGLAASATAVSMQSAANFVGENATHIEAIALAQEAIEDLRALPYEEIESGDRRSDDGRIALTWEVEADSPEVGTKSVAVAAGWTWKGEPRRYVLKTVYSRIGRN